MTEFNSTPFADPPVEAPRKRGRPRKYPLPVAEISPSAKVVHSVKLRAMQRLFYDDHIVEEGQVFLYVGDTLPDRYVAAPVDEEAEVWDPSEPMPVERGGVKPPTWTTKGYVDKANRNAGRRGG